MEKSVLQDCLFNSTSLNIVSDCNPERPIILFLSLQCYQLLAIIMREECRQAEYNIFSRGFRFSQRIVWLVLESNSSVFTDRCAREFFKFFLSNKMCLSDKNYYLKNVCIAYFCLDFNRLAGRCKIITLFYRYLLDSVDLITH